MMPTVPPPTAPEVRKAKWFQRAWFSRRERLDVIWLALVFGVVALVFGIPLIVVGIARYQGWFHATLLKPVPDHRILQNVRAGIAQSPILDATHQPGDEGIYVSTKGGKIHFYDLPTGLWKTEHPFASAHFEKPEIVLLRGGSGRDPESETAKVSWQERPTWGLTAGAGLIVRQNGKWQAVVTDTAWMGPDGKPVAQSEVKCAAVSTDQSWVAFGTAGKGLGLYDTSQHRWLKLDAAWQAKLPALEIQHIVFANGGFWLGTPRGLAFFKPDSPAPARVDGFPGEILSLAVTAKDSVIVLQRNPTEKVLRLGELAAPGAKPRLLMDESTLFPEANLQAWHHADYAGGRLWLAGKAGVYSYDPILRAQARHLQAAVTCVLAEGPGDFVVGFDGGVGRVHGGTFRTWKIDQERIVALQAGAAGSRTKTWLALAASGRLFSWDEANDAVSGVFDAQRSQQNVGDFSQALDLGAGKVLLLAANGALLHDIQQRTYEDLVPLPPQSGLAPFAQGFSGSFTSNQNLYGYRHDGRQTTLTTWPLAEARQGNFTPLNPTVRPLGDTQAVRPWGPGAAILGKNGVLLVLKEGTVANLLTEERYCRPGELMAGVKFRDVQPTPGGLIVAAGPLVGWYSAGARTWGNVLEMPGGEVAEGVQRWGNRYFLRTASESLFETDAQGTGIGAALKSNPWRLDDATLSSAALDEGRLYFAGPGRVEQYDLSRRSVTGSWSLEQNNASPRILGVVAGVPVTLAGDRVYIGSDPVEEDIGRVTSASLDGATLLTVREQPNHRFLRVFDLQQRIVRDTFFLSPTAGDGAREILDAVLFDARRIAAATDRGLRFYDLTARSWIQTRPILSGSRIFHLGGHLMLVEVERNSYRLTFVDDTKWIWRSPHGNLPAQHGTATSRSVRSYSIDPASQSVVILTQDGEIIRWQNGRETSLLPAPLTGPTAAWRRVFLREMEPAARLFCTTERELWSYNFAPRTWQNISLAAPGAILPWRELNLEPDGDYERITACDAAGHWFVGSLPRNSTQVRLGEVWRPPTETFAADPGRLITASRATAGNLWRFVLEDRIRRYDPAERKWLEDVAISGGMGSGAAYGKLLNRHIALSADGTRAWVATTDADDPLKFLPAVLNPKTTTYMDDGGALLRLDQNHVVVRSSVRNEKYEDYVSLTESPMALAPSDVSAVHRFGDQLYWSTSRGIRIWDQRRHVSPPTPAGLQALGRIDDAFVANGIFCLRGPGGFLPLWGSESSWAPLKTPQEVRVDETGRVWARTGGTWQTWNAGRLETVPPPAGGRVFVLEQGTCVILDAAGTPRRWDESRLPTSKRPLPGEWTDTAVTAVAPADDGGWWVRRNREWIQLREVSRWGEIPPVPLRLPSGLPMPWHEAPPSKNFRYKGGAAFGVITRYEVIQRLPATGDVGSPPPALTNRVLPRRQASPNIFASVSPNFARLIDGRTAYDPVLRIDIESDGRLVAARPSGTEYLADKGAAVARARLEAAPNLDAGWLKWDAARRVFQVQGVGQSATLTPAEAVRSGMFFFEPIDAVLSKDGQSIQWANAFGFWSNRASSLALSGTGITFDPQKAPPGVRTAAHGKFFAPDRDFSLGTNWEARPPARYSEKYGPLVLTEERLGGATAALAVGGATMDARRAAEFVWDAGRQHVAFGEDGVWLQTASGLVSVEQWGRWERLPADKGRLYGERSGITWFDAGDRWFVRNGGQWQPLPRDPTADRELVRTGAWHWQTRNHKVEVSIDGTPFGFAVVTDRNGIGFSSDRLLAAAAVDGNRWIASEAFLELVPPGTPPTGLTAGRVARSPEGNFEAWRDANGSSTLFLRTRAGVQRWETATQRFTPSADPLQQWDFVEAELLRFRLRAGRFLQELKADVPGSTPTWMPFKFERGRFPFDCVTAVWADQRALYLATRGGLLIHGPGAFSLLPSSVRGWWQPNGSAVQAATHVGRPAGEERLVANFGQTALESQDGVRFTGSKLHAGSWDRLQTDLWRWRLAARGQVELSYRNGTGPWTPMPEPVDSAARFPHDQLIDIAWSNPICGYLWANGWVSIAPNASVAVDNGWRHFDLSAARLSRLLAIPTDVPWTGGRILRAGLYALNQTDQIWYYENGTWLRVVEPTRVMDLRSFAAAPPILQRNRLRLMGGSRASPLRFEYRTLADEWKPLEWSTSSQGQLAVDAWEHFAPTADGVWAATSAGFVLFKPDPSGKLRLNPDELVINSDLAAKGAVITDLLPESGRWLARINQDSSQLWTGSLPPQKDRGTFSKYAGADTFADRLLVAAGASDFWEWRLVGRRNNNPGHIEGQLRGEPIRYDGGRFGFDALASVVVAQPEQLEILTAGEGWYRSRQSAFPVSEQKRPTATGQLKPSAVRDLFLSVEGHTTFLGAGDDQRKFWSVRGNRVDAVDQRLEFFGFDNFWRYGAMGDQLMIVPSRNESVVGGAAERRLQEGRFTDDRVKGFPLRTSAGWWVPTEAGVVEWTAPGAMRRIHAPSFGGLPKGDVPRAVYLNKDGKPLYASNDGLRFLDARRELADLPHVPVAPGAEISSVEAGPADTLRWRWSVGETIGWSLAAPVKPPWKSESVLPLRLDSLPIYETRRGSARPLPSSVWLDFATTGKVGVWEKDHTTPTFSIDVPSGFQLLKVAVAADRILLIGRTEIYEIEAEAIARRF